ncbi:MAG: AI-2E family transporter [Chloroflexia bacterium]|nr:AI-2E family transporter [Chloroflexia bacterium]
MPNPRLINMTLWLAIIGVSVFLIERFAVVTELLATPLLLFIIAWLIALIIEPLYDLLEQLRIARRFAVPIIYVMLLTLLTVAIFAFIPVTYTQLNLLIRNVPELLNLVTIFFTDIEKQLSKFGLHTDLTAVFRPEAIATQLGSFGGSAIQQSLGLAGGLAAIAFNIVIVLILSYYMAVDGPQLYNRLLHLCPADWQPEARTFSNIISQTFGGYMRAQILSSLLYAILNAIVMVAFGLNSITLTTIIVSIVVMVPLVGGAAALIPPIVVAGINKPEVIVPFVIVMLIVQQVLFNMILPRILGRIVGLHPLLVFAALLIGSVVAGSWGILFGIPLAGVAASIANYFYLRNQSTLSAEKFTSLQEP